MKGKQIARMFESIPKFDTYSHYNSTLEKLFKSNSLKTLIETLKRQKDINEISLLDQISKKDKQITELRNEVSDLNNKILTEINDRKTQNMLNGRTEKDLKNNILI